MNIKEWLKEETEGLNLTEETRGSPIFSYNDILELSEVVENE